MPNIKKIRLFTSISNDERYRRILRCYLERALKTGTIEGSLAAGNDLQKRLKGSDACSALLYLVWSDVKLENRDQVLRATFPDQAVEIIFRTAVENAQKQQRLLSAPGLRALRMIEFLVPKRAYEEIFRQAIADMREEYFAALAEGKTGKAKWIVCRDHIGLAITFVAYLASTLGKKLKSVWKVIS